MDFSHSRPSLRRSPWSYSKLQAAVAAVIRGRRAFVDWDSLRRKHYLDLGCGPNIHPCFINLDYAWRPGINLCWDITKGLPLADRSLAGIFSEHCLEHLSLATTDGVLAECWRVLQPGGTLRIVVPDGELYLMGYSSLMAGAAGRLPYADSDSYQGLYSPMLSVNRIFREHGHLFIYDYVTLAQLLERRGFIAIRREHFRSGYDQQLLIDSEHRAQESLYVEAQRPVS